MIFLIAGLISFRSQLAIGLANRADTVATVAIAAVVVAASRGGRYLPPIVNSWGSGLTIVMHSPSRRISSSSHCGLVLKTLLSVAAGMICLLSGFLTGGVSGSAFAAVSPNLGTAGGLSFCHKCGW
tara:strand:+ start:15928 stop:16305 length:378 start_codon:yes stop_codon:yes gene_type:complete